jgi:hypothetical protein
MVADLRYAIRQLVAAGTGHIGYKERDCLQRALDALERCLEEAENTVGGETDLAEAQSRGPGWTR